MAPADDEDTPINTSSLLARAVAAAAKLQTAPEPQPEPTSELPSGPAPRSQESGIAPATFSNPHRLRKAARVSVIASSTEPDLLLVRLLADDAVVPHDAAEALLVLTDPDSQVLARKSEEPGDANT